MQNNPYDPSWGGSTPQPPRPAGPAPGQDWRPSTYGYQSAGNRPPAGPLVQGVPTAAGQPVPPPGPSGGVQVQIDHTPAMPPVPIANTPYQPPVPQAMPVTPPVPSGFMRPAPPAYGGNDTTGEPRDIFADLGSPPTPPPAAYPTQPYQAAPPYGSGAPAAGSPAYGPAPAQPDGVDLAYQEQLRSLAPPAPPRRRGRWVFAVLFGLLMLAAAGYVGWLYLQGSQRLSSAAYHTAARAADTAAQSTGGLQQSVAALIDYTADGSQGDTSTGNTSPDAIDSSQASKAETDLLGQAKTASAAFDTATSALRRQPLSQDKTAAVLYKAYTAKTAGFHSTTDDMRHDYGLVLQPLDQCTAISSGYIIDFQAASQSEIDSAAAALQSCAGTVAAISDLKNAEIKSLVGDAAASYSQLADLYTQVGQAIAQKNSAALATYGTTRLGLNATAAAKAKAHRDALHKTLDAAAPTNEIKRLDDYLQQQAT